MPLNTLELDLVGQVELLDLLILFGQRLPPPPKQPGQQVLGQELLVRLLGTVTCRVWQLLEQFDRDD